MAGSSTDTEDKTTVQDTEVVEKESGGGIFDAVKIHSLSAMLVIGLDTMLFAGTVSSMGLLTILSVIGGFSMGFIGVTLIEKFFNGESTGKALTKGFVMGLLTGIPTPIAGTAVGAIILALGGINKLKADKLLSSNK